MTESDKPTMHLSRMPRSAVRGDAGALLAGVLFALLALGGIAAVVVVEMPSGGSSSSTSSKGSATTLSVSHPAGVISAAAVAACRNTYTVVQEAVDEYETQTGTGPTNIDQLRSLLRDPVVTSQYTISIDRRLAGEIDVATPSHPASPGESNCAYAGQ